jgi:acetyltransferase-like isoleucine patch superfamily enzyme
MHQRLKDKILHSDQYADVGRYTYGSPTFVVFPSGHKVSIGSFCSIADNVTFINGGNHYTDRITTYPLNLMFEEVNLPWHESTKGPINAGSDVWIGFGATILSGVTIGHGAVIGAGSVVTKDVEPYSIVAGSPARHIRFRFNPTTIKDLLEKAWWDLPIDEIEKLSGSLLNTPRSKCDS